ncbi:MAG TPA: pyridoxamine 5'-phosphate oxidase family protein [Actinomycetospora sp.]|nr:pyridoxamine 5'-phosphate oxidase family protein [Actinomycetospora sp.]
MSAPPDLAALGDESFVSLTTSRRTGDAVATPVWVARDDAADGTLVVTTPASSGKVERLRRDPRGRTGGGTGSSVRSSAWSVCSGAAPATA